MRVAFVSPTDAESDMRHFSGSTYHLYHALKTHADVIALAVPAAPWTGWRHPLQTVRQQVTGKRYKTDLHPDVLKQLAADAAAAAQNAGADQVLALGQGYLAFWDSPIPASFFSDTLYGAKFDFYDSWERHKLDALQVRQLREMGQAAVDHAESVFLTSQFAVDRARDQLGTVVPPEKLHITGIGANFSYAAFEIASAVPLPVLKLLWVGVNWERKGGSAALGVRTRLQSVGVRVELDLVGVDPPIHVHDDGTISIRTKTGLVAWDDGLRVHGFLSKTDPTASVILKNLFQTSDLLVLPSRADMTPAALAEAAAFGLVPVTTRVGGIPEMFSDEEAILVDSTGFVEQAAAAIVSRMRAGTLNPMRSAARRRYETHLNWDTIARQIISTITR